MSRHDGELHGYRGAVLLTVPEAMLARRVAMLLEAGFGLDNIAKMVEQHPLVGPLLSFAWLHI